MVAALSHPVSATVLLLGMAFCQHQYTNVFLKNVEAKAQRAKSKTGPTLDQVLEGKEIEEALRQQLSRYESIRVVSHTMLSLLTCTSIFRYLRISTTLAKANTLPGMK